MILSKQALQTTQYHNMLQPGDRVVAGLSGGADSVALLHWLCALREEYSLTLAAAHVNHGLRGAESDGDEAFCRTLCAARGVPLRVKRVDLRGLASGVEEAGRNVRYDFFAQLDCDKIALAHTLSDRTETFLMNIARGTALRGLCSIPPVRGNIIRPLIECTRAQVEEYCEANHLEYCKDSTNADLNYRRNFVRHEIVPRLGWQPEQLRRMFRALEEDEAYLSQAAQGPEDILAAPAPLKNRALRQTLADQGREPSQARMRELEKQGPVGAACQPPASHREKTIQILPLPMDFTKNLNNIQKNDLANCLDYDTIVGTLRECRRAPGHAMRLCNGAGTKSLKKLCQERGVPPGERELLALLRDDAGLAWIEGMGCAHRCRITEHTTRAIQIQLTIDS